MTADTHHAIKRMFDEYLVRQRWKEESILNTQYSIQILINTNQIFMTATAIDTPEEQKKEFNRFFDKVLNKRYTSKIETNDDVLIESAQINTDEILDKTQMALIMEVADAYRHDFQIKRSGTGIRIIFTLIKD